MRERGYPRIGVIVKNNVNTKNLKKRPSRSLEKTSEEKEVVKSDIAFADPEKNRQFVNRLLSLAD